VGWRVPLWPSIIANQRGKSPQLAPIPWASPSSPVQAFSSKRMWWLLACVALLAPSHAGVTSIPASDPQHVAWVGRHAASGPAVYLDWVGVSATVMVVNASWLTVDIADHCPGTSAGGGSRWGVVMNQTKTAAFPYGPVAPHHRIQTFYTLPSIPTYALYSNPTQACDPECSVSTPTAFTLVRLVGDRQSGCSSQGGNLSVVAFASDGTFVAPPPPSSRRLEFIGDSITAGGNALRTAQPEVPLLPPLAPSRGRMASSQPCLHVLVHCVDRVQRQEAAPAWVVVCVVVLCPRRQSQRRGRCVRVCQRSIQQ
jgi:hypothetical protein